MLLSVHFLFPPK